MKKFLLKMFCFILPFIILFIFAEYRLSRVENSYTFKKKNIEKQLNEIEVLNLGSSHGNYGLDSDFYSYRGYNMANVSQSLYYDSHIFNKYCDKMKNLKVVIIPVSPFTLGFKMIDSEEYWREFFYEWFYGIPMENSSKLIDMRRFSLFALYGNKESMQYLKNPNRINIENDFKENGSNIKKQYNLEEYMGNISETEGKKRADFHEKIFDKKNIDENIFYLEEIVKKCREKNIVPIIITTPTYVTYYENLNRENLKITEQKLGEIQKKYGVEYYNYLKDSRFVKEDFKDNDHLNPKGAEKFSKIVDMEILKKSIK